MLSHLMKAEHVDVAQYRKAVWCMDTQSVGGMPDNFRTMTGEWVPPNPDLGMDPSFVASREGLDTLRMSGSGQFGQAQLDEMLAHIRQLTAGPVCVVDLRQETHLLVDGLPVSLYGKRNRANIGMTLAEVNADERWLRQSIKCQPLVAALPLHEEDGLATVTLEASQVATEKELVEAAGCGYLRVPVTDRSWPVPRLVDDFVNFARDLPADTWMHFHCKAGKGRTGEFMVMYDMMRNPQVPVEDVAYRQYQLGAGFMLSTATTGTWMDPYDAERAAMTREFSRYVQACAADNFAITWSQWLG